MFPPFPFSIAERCLAHGSTNVQQLNDHGGEVRLAPICLLPKQKKIRHNDRLVLWVYPRQLASRAHTSILFHKLHPTFNPL
jgi:hypothetical protein